MRLRFGVGKGSLKIANPQFLSDAPVQVVSPEKLAKSACVLGVSTSIAQWADQTTEWTVLACCEID
jgi:hypothetical protein